MTAGLGSPLFDTAVGDLPNVFARHVECAVAASVHEALAMLGSGRVDALLVIDHGAAYALTRGDFERVLPSPATALARHEIRELLGRLAVRHALRAPARAVRADASLGDAVGALRDGDGRPIVVLADAGVMGVITAQSLLAGIAGDGTARGSAEPASTAARTV